MLVAVSSSYIHCCAATKIFLVELRPFRSYSVRAILPDYSAPRQRPVRLDGSRPVAELEVHGHRDCLETAPLRMDSVGHNGWVLLGQALLKTGDSSLSPYPVVVVTVDSPLNEIPFEMTVILLCCMFVAYQPA